MNNSEKKKKRLETQRKAEHKEALLKCALSEYNGSYTSKQRKKDQLAKVGYEIASVIRANDLNVKSMQYENWKPRSHNEKAQRVEFFKKFVYPYSLPAPLLNELFEPSHYTGAKIAARYLNAIISGKSFYKALKPEFTKAEAHSFLTAAKYLPENCSLTQFYAFALCKARNMKYAEKYSKAFNKKRVLLLNIEYYRPVIKQYLDFLKRTEDEYIWAQDEFEDSLDFIIAHYNFSFSGRTINSFINVINDWHIQVANNSKEQKSSHYNWKGFDIPNFEKAYRFTKYEQKIESYATITQLLTGNQLFEEGKKMHHCVGTYVTRARNGETSIWSLKIDNIREATLEITSQKKLVQARGHCNRIPEKSTWTIIKDFCKLNKIGIAC